MLLPVMACLLAVTDAGMYNLHCASNSNSCMFLTMWYSNVDTALLTQQTGTLQMTN